MKKLFLISGAALAMGACAEAPRNLVRQRTFEQHALGLDAAQTEHAISDEPRADEQASGERRRSRGRRAGVPERIRHRVRPGRKSVLRTLAGNPAEFLPPG